jgi:hypothetical protein
MSYSDPNMEQMRELMKEDSGEGGAKAKEHRRQTAHTVP